MCIRDSCYDDVRKLAAIEALSRYGKAQGRMLGSITIAPNQWPTHAVIDWLNILKRVADVPERDKRMAEDDTIEEQEKLLKQLKAQAEAQKKEE